MTSFSLQPHEVFRDIGTEAQGPCPSSPSREEWGWDWPSSFSATGCGVCTLKHCHSHQYLLGLRVLVFLIISGHSKFTVSKNRQRPTSLQRCHLLLLPGTCPVHIKAPLSQNGVAFPSLSVCLSLPFNGTRFFFHRGTSLFWRGVWCMWEEGILKSMN